MGTVGRLASLGRTTRGLIGKIHRCAPLVTIGEMGCNRSGMGLLLGRGPNVAHARPFNSSKFLAGSGTLCASCLRHRRIWKGTRDGLLDWFLSGVVGAMMAFS